MLRRPERLERARMDQANQNSQNSQNSYETDDSDVGFLTGTVPRPLPSPMQTMFSQAQHLVRRFDRRRVLALVVAIGVALLVGRSLDRARATVFDLGTMRPTLVATTHVAAGESLGEGNTRVEDWPISFRPEAAVGSEVIGFTATSPVAAGQAVTLTNLVADRHGLTSGQRAVTIAMPLAPPPLVSGDLVEVVGLEGAEGIVRASVLSRATVAVVDDETITLLVPSGAANAVIRFMAAGSVEVMRVPTG